MNIQNILDDITSFIIDPNNDKRKPLTRGMAWAVTIILGIGTIGIAHCLSALWRKLRRIDKNDRTEKIDQIFQGKVINKNSDSQPPQPTKIEPIAKQFTVNKSIDEQRVAHNAAKNYLEKEAKTMGADVCFVSSDSGLFHQKITEIEIEIDSSLDAAIFSWENTTGVEKDIQKDGKICGQIVLYGVASQFNFCEATHRFTPKPGTAVETYKDDHTQGPYAQLQFPDNQVEIINNAANLGFNGLCQVLDDNTKQTVQHGYFTPETEESADAVIEQLQKRGNKIEFLCIGNIPKGENSEKVYEMLVAAPAFGQYKGKKNPITKDQEKEIEFLCALYGYRAQFQQAIRLANLNPGKQTIFKPTTPGLGAFGNKVESITKAFYVAAKEYENQLKEKNIQVRLQVFHSKSKNKSKARFMADTLGLDRTL